MHTKEYGRNSINYPYFIIYCKALPGGVGGGDGSDGGSEGPKILNR